MAIVGILVGADGVMCQLAVNFPLVDVTLENGPIEIAPGTHVMSKDEGMAKLAAGEVTLNPYPPAAGDLMIRDVRGLHRPEVRVDVPRSTWEGLSTRSKAWLRFNPIVEKVEKATEVYQAFAY